jgi:hypothetical protein
LIPERAPSKISHDAALATLKLNLLAPIPRTIELEYVEGLNDAALVAFMSARVGSISDNRRGGWYSYQASKAELNQLVKTFSCKQGRRRWVWGCIRGW